MNENAENFMHFLMSLQESGSNLKVINVHSGCCLVVKCKMEDLDPVFEKHPDVEVFHSVKQEYHYFVVR